MENSPQNLLTARPFKRRTALESSIKRHPVPSNSEGKGRFGRREFFVTALESAFSAKTADFRGGWGGIPKNLNQIQLDQGEMTLYVT